MRVAIAQIDPTVGAIDLNVSKIKESYSRACAAGARVLLTPELGICGYPPHDLVERPELIERCDQAVQELAKLTRGKPCALVVGHVAANSDERGRRALNVASVLEDGKVAFCQAKTLLPTYDVFDEVRYFEPAREVAVWNCDGSKIAIAICEDLWSRHPVLGHRIYGADPVDSYAQAGVDLVFSISASPFELGKNEIREKLHAEIAVRLDAPIVYVNQVGATDEILFDGCSFVSAPASMGSGLIRLPVFQEAFGLVELRKGVPALQWLEPSTSSEVPEAEEQLSRGLVVGIQEYFSTSGFKKALIGLSGGIDSAVVATLAARALGPENVLGVGMPGPYSSGHSLEDAEALARNLGIAFEVRQIKFFYTVLSKELEGMRGPLAPIAQENLQARLRGMVLMTLSNHKNALVLTTGNKSELAMGYCTLYGDMVGALGPIGDLLKTQVYDLAHYLNRSWGNPIPERSLTKAPSAELRPNQTDQDTLPPYDELDALLEAYLVEGLSARELQKKYGNWVTAILNRLEMNEYKRRQAVPVLRVSPKAFGLGRRMPIAKRWNY